MKCASETIDVDLITVPPDRHRAIDTASVKRIASSIAELGLRTPITVLDVNEGERLDLVAGAHRLAAIKQLGLTQVECFIIEGDGLDARLWEVAENLHRADLSKEQRDEHIRLYAELLVAKDAVGISGQVVQKIGRGRPKEIASKVAEQTGLSQRTVRRALSAETGQQREKSQRAKIDGDVQDRAAREIAELLAEHVPADAWDAVKANLYAAKSASRIADQFSNITGQSIMDRRGWAA